MKKVITTILIFASFSSILGQDSSKSSLTFSGYAEVYYQYDLNKPSDNTRPGFIYSHNRHNEFNLNLGFLKANYTSDRIRANLALAAGTYMNANYSAEPGVLKNIYEANAGFKIVKNENFWLDAGIMNSHIGFESAISKDCWTLTRSIPADNSPYYESGAKLTYVTDNGKWLISGLALNGWQRITRVSGNSLMSFGTQLQFRPSDKVLLNYSTFIGTDKPDSVRLLRIFHNLYGIFTINDNLGIIIGFDIGTEEKTPAGNETNTWYSPVGILKYTISDKWAISGRVEHYNDENGVIISSSTPNGFQTTGYSLNFDFGPSKNMLIRIEAKTLNSKDDNFSKGDAKVNNNTSIITSLAVSF